MAEFAEEKIAKDFKIGNTRVRIATDFCDTTFYCNHEKERFSKFIKHPPLILFNKNYPAAV